MRGASRGGRGRAVAARGAGAQPGGHARARTAAAPGARAVAWLLALLALAAAPGAARADGAADVLRMRAEQLAAEGRCGEAVPLLERARAAAPDDARVLDALGRCQLRLERWEAAVEALSAAKAADPATRDVDLHLAVARFHAGDVEGAAAALADARARGADDAQADLYEGLVALERGEAGVAAERLERAARRDPVGVEPVASYYAGVAWLRADRRSEARAALERVQREAPGTPWAAAAARALDAGAAPRGLRVRRDLEAPQHAERPLGSMAEIHRPNLWATLSAGFEYDDNVVLRGDGVTLPDEISDEDDVRAVWTAQIGTELFRRGGWSLGAMAAYYGSAHADLTDFDTQYPSATVWLDRRLGERTTLRLQYDFSYAWVGYDPYLREHALTPALYHHWGRWGTTRLFTELSWDDYRFEPEDVQGLPGGVCPDPGDACGPAGLDESEERNRDGLWLVAGLDHVFPVEALHTELSLGYRFHRYDAEGREYEYDGHEVQVGARTALPWRFALDLQGSFTWRDYHAPSTYPDPDDVVAGVAYALDDSDKRERIWEVDGILSRPITDWLIGSVRVAWQKVDANVEVFDYDRWIAGAYLTVRLPR